MGQIIQLWIEMHVCKTGMLMDEPTRECSRPVHGIGCVKKPSTSNRHHQQQLDILLTSLMRIMRKDLAMKPYKLQLVQQLKSIFESSKVRKLD